MKSLAEMKCLPCQGGEPTVTEEEMGEWKPKVPEWQVPERLHYMADGPDLLYQWYVYVEKDYASGSALPISRESDPLSFKWE